MHYFALVILPEGTEQDKVNEAVEEMLEPFMASYDFESEEDEDEDEELPKLDGWDFGGRYNGVVRGQYRGDGKGGFNFEEEFRTVEANTNTVKDVLALIDSMRDQEHCPIPHAILTPEGDWIEWDEFHDHDIEKWDNTAIELLKKYPEYQVVGIDCHN